MISPLFDQNQPLTTKIKCTLFIHINSLLGPKSKLFNENGSNINLRKF